MLVKKQSFAIKQKGNPQPLVKNNIPKQHGEEKLKTLRIVFSLWGLLSFKTCHRSFSSENAVSLTSSHAAEPRCITMTQECPSLRQGNLHSATALWGRGGLKKGEGIVQEWVRAAEGRGLNKREADYPWSRLIRKPTQGNPSPAGSNSGLCARWSPVKAAATHVSSLLPLLSPLFTRQCSSHPHLSDSHQRQRVSFSHTLWNPTQVRTLAGPDDPQALSSVMAHWWYIPLLISLCEPVYASTPTPSSLLMKVLPKIW